jgi:Domain of Unknown Function (DUF1080)
MRNPTESSRRRWLQLAGIAAAGFSLRADDRPAMLPLFDGRSLDGWLQIENSATTLGSGGILDAPAFTRKLSAGSDPLSAFLRGGMDAGLVSDLAAFSPAAENAKAVISALVKYLNQAIAGPPLYGPARFRGVVLRAETVQLLDRNPPGQLLARLNKLLLEDAYAQELQQSVSTGWVAKDGAMASTGVGRGVIYTARDFTRFRLLFTMRHVSGNPDHQACVLIFCRRPQGDEKPLDALGGIQFQVPNGGHWDYRPGMNNAGGTEFTKVTQTRFDPHEWSRVEIVADAASGTGRMAVAQPLGAKAVEVLAFRDPAAGRTGPIAWQMHNAGLFDEYKDVAVEVDPKDDGLITAR